MRHTGLAKETVRRFYRAQTADEVLAKTMDGRPSLLDQMYGRATFPLLRKRVLLTR